MFFSWSSANKSVHVDAAGERHCDRCGQTSMFQHWVHYTVRHFYWLFRWVTNRQHELVCSNCGAGYHGDDSIEPQTVKHAIPFFDRRGWTLGAGAIASLFAVGAVANAADEKDNKAYIAAPHVGDVYALDAARLSANPEAPLMYSTMRVTRVAGNEIELHLSKAYYEGRRGIDRDINAEKAKDPAYYSEEAGLVDRQKVAEWYDKGIIYDVERQ